MTFTPITYTAGASVFKASDLNYIQTQYTEAKAYADTLLGPSAAGVSLPGDQGLTAWTYDPSLASQTQALTNGTQYFAKLHVRADVTISKIYWCVAGTPTTATSSQNKVGLYSSAGTLLQNTDVTSDLTTTGVKTTTITSQALTAGTFVWVAFLFNCSSGSVTFPNGSNATGGQSLPNVGLSASTYRYAINGTSKTALDSSITPASNSLGLSIWAGMGT